MMNKKTNVEWRMVIERKDEHRTLVASGAAEGG
jgi:hypothetical protein